MNQQLQKILFETAIFPQLHMGFGERIEEEMKKQGQKKENSIPYEILSWVMDVS